MRCIHVVYYVVYRIYMVVLLQWKIYVDINSYTYYMSKCVCVHHFTLRSRWVSWLLFSQTVFFQPYVTLCNLESWNISFSPYSLSQTKTNVLWCASKPLSCIHIYTDCSVCMFFAFIFSSFFFITWLAVKGQNEKVEIDLAAEQPASKQVKRKCNAE